MSLRFFPCRAALSLALAIFPLSACHSNSSGTPASTPPQAANQPPASPQTGIPAGAVAGSQSQPPAQASVPAPPPPPAVIELPEGTTIPVRLDSDLGSKISQSGDTFQATVSQDIRAHGEVVIPRGARASGTVVDAEPLGRFKGGARLEVRLDRVRTRWGSYAVATSSIDKVQQGKGKRSAGFIGGGAGLGAIIGGLAGGGKGAAIGALAGGGAGTAGSAFTGNKQIELPAETLLTFRLRHSVHITQSGPGESDPSPTLHTR